jgi:ankyrin repeat protein
VSSDPLFTSSSALHAAAAYASPEILWKLLQGKPPCTIDDESLSLNTRGIPLLFACLIGNCKCAKYLLKHGAKIDYEFPLTSESMLHAAVPHGSRQHANLLLTKHRFDINKPDKYDMSSPLRACAEGNIHAATVFLRKGADATQTSKDFRTALSYCATSQSPKRLKIAKLMLRDKNWHFMDKELNVALNEACAHKTGIKNWPSFS